MKKIERYRQVFSGDILKTNKPEFLLSYCIVDEKALTEQEAYVEQLEAEVIDGDMAIGVLRDQVRYVEQLEREKETLKYIIHQCRRAVPHHDIDGVHNNQVCLRCKLNRLIDSAWQELKGERG